MTIESVLGQGAGVVEIDPHGRDIAQSATGLLAALNRAGVLTAADIGVAMRLGRLGGLAGLPELNQSGSAHQSAGASRPGGDDQRGDAKQPGDADRPGETHQPNEASETELVLLAAALAVRAVRHGSVCLDLASLAEREPDHVWPPLPQWRETLLGSPLVREPSSVAVTPLVWEADRLYLDRYWEQEGQVVRDVLERQGSAPQVSAALAEALDAYFPKAAAAGADDYADQRSAAEAAARNWLTIITGGPGTGKTTTIARLLGVLLDGEPDLRVALAAPTGRAAARLSEAVAEATRAATFPPAQRDRIASLHASTLHRLLGWQPGRRTFRHDHTNRLPYDVVVVDETSMVSLTMMARLLDALRPGTKLLLVGDADQLASVDAGAVLGDLVAGLGGPGGVTSVAAGASEGRAGAAAQVRVLGPSRRFGAAIGALADAIRDRDPDEAIRLLLATDLNTASDDVELIDPATAGTAVLDDLVIGHARVLRRCAVEGDIDGALTALDAHRLLCAHREGPFGAGFWNRRVERALAEGEGRLGGLGQWYQGRPIIVTENDYGLTLYNGDIGVVIADPATEGSLVAVISEGEGKAGRSLPVGRLPEVRSAHAMTVHRSQGSQVDEVTVLLPDSASRLLTRQLLYTAVTRAKSRVRVVGSVEAVRAAVLADAPRASGLASRLSHAPPS